MGFDITKSYRVDTKTIKVGILKAWTCPDKYLSEFVKYVENEYPGYDWDGHTPENLKLFDDKNPAVYWVENSKLLPSLFQYCSLEQYYHWGYNIECIPVSFVKIIRDKKINEITK